MSFRTDKIRGAHPITPRKGIKEIDLNKNNDGTIKIIKERYEKVMNSLDENPAVYGTQGNRTKEYFAKIREYENAMKKDIEESGEPGITEYYMGRLYRVTEPTEIKELTKRDINLKLEVLRSDYRQADKRVKHILETNDRKNLDYFKKQRDEYYREIEELEELRKKHIEPPHHTKRIVDLEILKKYLERGDTSSGLISTDNNFQTNHPFHAETLQGMVDLGLIKKVDPTSVLSPFHTHYRLTSEARKLLHFTAREKKYNDMSVQQREKILKKSFPNEANAEGVAEFSYGQLDPEIQDKLKF